MPKEPWLVPQRTNSIPVVQKLTESKFGISKFGIPIEIRRSAELTNALLCRLMKKKQTLTGFRKCLKTPSKAICGRGGRVPNVMAELQRAILDGVLDLRSIEAHLLVCLSHNLHVKDLRQTRYTKAFVEFHKYLSCLPSAAATHSARRGRGPAADAHRARHRAGGGELFLACAHECQTRP
jgi:hypothetical protein